MVGKHRVFTLNLKQANWQVTVSSLETEKCAPKRVNGVREVSGIMQHCDLGDNTLLPVMSRTLLSSAFQSCVLGSSSRKVNSWWTDSETSGLGWPCISRFSRWQWKRYSPTLLLWWFYHLNSQKVIWWASVVCCSLFKYTEVSEDSKVGKSPPNFWGISMADVIYQLLEDAFCCRTNGWN